MSRRASSRSHDLFPPHYVASPKWTHDQRPDLVARARRLVEESGLGRVAIAAELGVGVATVTNWRRRFGWVWAPGPRRGRRPAVAGVAWPKLHRRAEGGPGREHPPAVVAEARRLFEEGELTRAAIAARLGVGIVAIRRWAARGNWRYPARWEVASRLTPVREGIGIITAPEPRARRGRGRPYRRETRERAQALVEGSGLTQGAIAAQLGIAQSTVARWTVERGWRRPVDAYRSSRAVPADRAGLSARLAAGFARVAALAEEESGRLRSAMVDATAPDAFLPPCGEGGPSEAEGRMGVHPPHDRPGSRWSHPHPGSTLRVDSALPTRGREGAPRRAMDDKTAALVRLARNARRLARLYDRAGLARLPVPRRSFGGEAWEPVRLSVAPRGPRHHPRGEDVLAQARHAWEGGCETRETIARTLGVSRTTLTRWAQTGGWIRPDGAHSPIGRPRNPGFRTRMQQRIEARLRLGEAEGMLEGFRHCERSEATQDGDAGGPWVASPDQVRGPATPPRDDGSAALEAAFGLLRGAAEIVGRPLPTERDLETPRARRGRRVRPSGR